ncbi:hypothetical protein FA95DRAFT_1580210 [Auriscalpium vulgare]|uniref:Uncharacterized protein n=1 Tax=Auriscalpium vulgare TaxID=40419 RepID=A0ACB8S8I7_9AGAM|nr:hypothetical protein FA95DRAFT_1580210 [Auriscalpium vulgare]
MADRGGLPLLSGPAPPPHDSSRADISCRRCNKEFNIIFTRAKRCNHCGYNYCSSCSDYQALMPRQGMDSGYDAVPVCAFCIENLTITAGGRNYLRTLSLARLKRYVDAYNIKAVGVLEKDDLINKMIGARGQNGCLPHVNETYYRKYSVPNGRTGRPRGLFSRGDPVPTPQQPARSTNPPTTFARPDLDPDVQRQPSSSQSQSRRAPPRAQPYPPPRSTPPPVHSPRPEQANSTPPPFPRPNTVHPTGPGNMPGTWASDHPSRAASAAPAPPPRAPTPIPTLDQLLDMTEVAMSALSISSLKAVLFHNHVNARLLLEKSELVQRVKALVEDERRERAREAAVHAREEEEIIARQHAMMEEHRAREEQVREDREAREREEAAPATTPTPDGDGTPATVDSGAPSPPKAMPPLRPNAAAELERTGLCVICQDEEANIAIVDCGHLAMCRNCSDLVMGSSRECPLCRTRIVTEARLLRIFKT